jgi:hypothetical protein
MLQPRLQQWQNILQMTDKLHQLSADENWQAMTELEAQRFTQLESFFSVRIAETEAAEVEKGLSHMLKSDGLLMQASINQQKILSDGVKKISRGRQVIKAYGDIQK